MAKRTPLNTAIGNDELCAWQPVLGIVWVQTRSPVFARKLADRKDGRLVARGVAGGYLRTYEFEKDWTWAKELIARYNADGQAIKGGKNGSGRAGSS